MADVRPGRHQSDDGLGPQQRGDRHVTRHIGIPEDLVEPLAEQHLCGQSCRSSLCSTERLARIERVSIPCRYEHEHDPECSRTRAAAVNTICGNLFGRRLGSTRAVSRRLARVQQPPKTLVSRLKTANARFPRARMSAQDHAGAVSERMSIRQPVSRAASRAFWPSRPMASDS